MLTGTGERLDGADVLLRDGKVAAVGKGLDGGDAQVIDASGRWVTPGLIDVHSHLGVYASPGVTAHQDGNEMIDPVTAQAWAEHAVWPQDPGFETALEDHLLKSMLPADIARTVLRTLHQFAVNAGELTWMGSLLLLKTNAVTISRALPISIQRVQWMPFLFHIKLRPILSIKISYPIWQF